jgi:hypothetical protein
VHLRQVTVSRVKVSLLYPPGRVRMTCEENRTGAECSETSSISDMSRDVSCVVGNLVNLIYFQCKENPDRVA